MEVEEVSVADKRYVIEQENFAAAMQAIRVWYREKKESERRENGIMKRDKVGTAICISLQAVFMAAGLVAFQEKSGALSLPYTQATRENAVFKVVQNLFKEV